MIAQAGQMGSIIKDRHEHGRARHRYSASDAGARAGGLHVDLTERHEMARIDRQLKAAADARATGSRRLHSVLGRRGTDSCLARRGEARAAAARSMGDDRRRLHFAARRPGPHGKEISRPASAATWWP